MQYSQIEAKWQKMVENTLKAYYIKLNKRIYTKGELKMKKTELIKRFELTKTNTKCYFYDGRTRMNRTLYVDRKNNLFVFYNNDLHTVRPAKNEEYSDNMEALNGYLGAGYNWYH